MIERITLKKQAYDYLYKIILNEEIKQDDVYSEQYFADLLGISRTPIREAVLQLTQEGFLKIYPNKGFSVKPVSGKELTEMYSLRGAIEGYCAAAAAEKKQTEEVKALLESLEKYNFVEHDAGKRGASAEECMEEDFMFHTILAEFTQNTLIKETMENLRAKISMAGVISIYKKESRIMDIFNEHKKIIEAIEDGNKVAAYEAVQTHFNNSLCLVIEK